MKKNIIVKAIAAVLTIAMSIGFINIQSFAYSEVPDYFDFGDCVVTMDAGSQRDVWFRSNYNYEVYLGNHTSDRTYISYSGKEGHEYVTIHIGADETEKNVMFYFYVRDDRVSDKGIYDAIEVYVQNIDYTYAQQVQQAGILKYYANNNREFNAYDYYMNYPDLRTACGIDGNALFNHYYTMGQAEHRVANKLIA